jgi:hypothetical protein
VILSNADADASSVIAIPSPVVAGAGATFKAIVLASSANTVTLTPAAGNIDGAAGAILAAGDAKMYISDGVDWVSIQ